MVRGLPRYPDLSVLDVSCGDAEILERLMEDGCFVEGTHYVADDWILSEDRRIPDGIRIHEGVDLSAPLPFPNGAFDVVLCTEVIEHLDGHVGIVHELGRIVGEGGHLVLSVPNIHRIRSRWQFFLTGCHRLCQRRTSWDVPRERLYEYHIRPPDFPLLHTLLHQAGLQIQHLAFTRVEFPHHLWLPLYPLFYLAARLQIRPRSKYPALRNEGERDLLRWMTHPCMLASKQLLLCARKR